MPNIYNSGSFLYPSGSETSNVIGGAVTVQLGTGDVNNPRTVLASGTAAVIKLPDVSNTAYASGQAHFVGFIPSSSYPVQVRNSGDPTKEPTLEKILTPGTMFEFQLLSGNASGTFGNYNFSASGGNWAFNSIFSPTNYPDLRILSRLAYGKTDVMVGSSGTVASTSRGCVMLSGGLAALVYADASHNINAVPFQISSDGLTQTSGVVTQIAANGGATLRDAIVSRAVGGNNVSGTALVSWFDATNNKNGFGVITVTSGVTVPTVSVGALSDDTTAVAASGSRINDPGSIGCELFQDANIGPNQWLAGPQITGGKNIAYYVVVSGTTATVSGTLAYDTTEAALSGFGYVGASTTTGSCLVPSNRGDHVYALTASSGVVTSGYALNFTGFASPDISGGSTGVLRIDFVDQKETAYLLTQAMISGGTPNQTITHSVVFKVDTVNKLPLDLRVIHGYADDTSVGIMPLNSWSNGGSFAKMGDGEVVAFSEVLSAAYYDIKSFYKVGPSATSNTTSQGALQPQVIGWRAPTTVSYFSSAYISLAAHADPATRRVMFVYGAISGSTPIASFFEFPKR